MRTLDQLPVAPPPGEQRRDGPPRQPEQRVLVALGAAWALTSGWFLFWPGPRARFWSCRCGWAKRSSGAKP